MNFVGIGPQELVVILVIALIFVGPQRLPKLAADLARMIREIRQYTGGIAAEFGEAIKEFEKDTEPERTKWKEIGQGLGDASKAATDVAKGVSDDAKGLPAPPPPLGESTNGASNGATPATSAGTPANGSTDSAPATNAATTNGAAPEPAPTTEERP
jgi:sec-independent protein translocase protein TatB